MTEPTYSDPLVTLYTGDCLDVLMELPDESVDSVVTDPPYNLTFMGRSWDAFEGREDAGFGYWLAGLIDGEGHFAIKKHTRGTHAPAFALKMRADERGTLEAIKRHTGFGTLNEEQRDGNPMVKWIVQDKAGCQKLVELLDKYPLRAKKRQDYNIWREAVCEWTDRPRGNRWHGAVADERMSSLRGRLMKVRNYVEPAWSGHEYQDWSRLWALECFRVLKPGGYLLAFSGTRTYHRMTSGIEDAGFEIRDSLHHIYASGFPKSLDVSKALDKAKGNKAASLGEFIRVHREAAGLSRQDAAERLFGTRTGAFWNWEEGMPQGKHPGPDPALWPRIKEVIGAPDSEWDDLLMAAERDVIGRGHAGLTAGSIANFAGTPEFDITAPATDLARKWEGWGTALKPAHEPIVMARKPLVGTVAANVTRYGTGALNIDGTRIGTTKDVPFGKPSNVRGSDGWGMQEPDLDSDGRNPNVGRWPSNVLLSDADLFDYPNPYVVGSGATAQSAGQYREPGTLKERGARGGADGDGFLGGLVEGSLRDNSYANETGGYSRFFIIPKADRAERERGLAGAPKRHAPKMDGGKFVNPQWDSVSTETLRANVHPTVKPIDLMRHLVRLVTPPGGVTLDPFAGSGTTGLAASEEGFRCILIEREAEYCEIIVGRLMATPMGLGLDVPLAGRRDIGRERGNRDEHGNLTWKAPSSPTSWFHSESDEEPAA